MNPLTGFIKVFGLTGESTDSAHKDWSELVTFAWGVSQAAGTSGGAGNERADFTDLSVLKPVDRMSSALISKCCSGQRISKVQIELCERANEMMAAWLTLTFEEVVVSSVELDGQVQDPSSRRPLEHVTFRYSKVRWGYEMTTASGMRAGKMESGWDLERNKAL